MDSMQTVDVWRRTIDGMFFLKRNDAWIRHGINDASTKKLFKNGNICYFCLLDKECNRCHSSDILMHCGEIVDMHPIVIIRILQKFGFRCYEEYDDIFRIKLKKVESAEHWLSKNRKHIDSETKHMLDLLVQFVNNNPGLLNLDYIGSRSSSIF